ncbi:MAG TPA: ABC transporter permease [Candidatus Thermoplasmatota archaeon]|nr:ABC transporter permease [Candidatus Thermoplasmatota archaeon]
MAPISTTLGLVLSRMKYDWKRHLAALSVVAILMASFMTFTAVSAGMQDGLQDTVHEQRWNHVQLNSQTFGPDATGFTQGDVEQVEALDGVLEVATRTAIATGIEVEQAAGQGPVIIQGPPGNGTGGNATVMPLNLTRELVLVGIDPAAEGQLLVQGTESATDAPPGGFAVGGPGMNFMFRGQARNYTLLEGHWIQGGGDAVVSQSAADAGYGLGETVDANGQTYTVVGVIDNRHPATGSLPGIIAAGQILVDQDTLEGGTIVGLHVIVDDNFDAIQSVSTNLIEKYPQSTGPLQASLAEFERDQYDSSRTATVLGAAGRLVGVAGAATVFAMSFFLLIGERASIGTMAAVGFTRTRLASYMTNKMLILAGIGVAAGAVAGLVAIYATPMPEASFSFEPAVNSMTYATASVSTLVAALLGSALSFFLVIRQDPIKAIQAAE